MLCDNVTVTLRYIVAKKVNIMSESAAEDNDKTLEEIGITAQADPDYARLRLQTDGGPRFTSRELCDFMDRWGVRHVISSPHYPQSNGHAEAAVKSVKHLIMKVAPSGNTDCEEFYRGLLELHNTPNFAR